MTGVYIRKKDFGFRLPKFYKAILLNFTSCFYNSVCLEERNRMKGFYFSSTLMWDADAETLMRTAAENGFDGIELWAQHAETKKLDLETIRWLKKELGLNIVVHAKSWDLNYAALNDAVRRASVEEIKSSVDLAVELGADEVTVHPPRYTLKEDEAARDRAYESIREFYGYAKERGVDISMEIMEHIPKEMATTPDGMFGIVRDLRGKLTYTIDLAHSLTEEEFFENIRIMGRVSKVHLTNKKGTKLHTPIPDGDFDFEEIYPRLLAYGFPMVIEGYEEGDRYEALTENIQYIQTLKEKRNEEIKRTFNNSGYPGTYRLQFQQ